MGTALRIELLGPLRVSRAGDAAALPRSRKARALLAWLALNPGPHRRERLCDLFWDGEDDPRAALRWHLAQIRPLLGDALIAGRDTVELRRAALALDILDAVAEADVAARAGLFRGELIEGSDLPDNPAFQAWCLAERAYWHNRRKAALAGWVDALAASGRHGDALGPAQRLMALDLFDSDGHVRLLDLFARAGRESEAAQLALALEQMLVREGMPPSPGLARFRPSDRAGAPPLPDASRPAIAVLPFVAPADRSFLAEGLASEVTDALARCSSLSVIARTAVLAADRSDPGAWRGLGARYVLRGSIEAAAGAFRIRLELSGTADNGLLWSAAFAGEGEEIFRLCGDIAAKVAARLEHHLPHVEARLAGARSPTSWAAHEHYLRAIHHVGPLGGLDYPRAVRHAEAALALDPDYAPAAALAAWAAMQTTERFVEAERARALARAERAVEIAPLDTAVLSRAAAAIGLAGEDFDRAEQLLRQALALNPNHLTSWVVLGWVHAWRGESAAALDSFAIATSLCPDSQSNHSIDAGRALACFHAGDLDAAIAWAEAGLARDGSARPALRVLIAALAEQSRSDAARAAFARLRAIAPAETQTSLRAVLRYRAPGLAERLLAALAALGLPE